MDSLAQHYRVVAPDLRGYGDSEDGEHGIAMGDFSADLLRLMTEAGIDRAHIVGLSMGGFIALQCLADFPRRIASLVLADTAWSLRAAIGAEQADAFYESRAAMMQRGTPMAELADALTPALVWRGTRSPAYAEAWASMAQLRPASCLRALEAVRDFENPLPAGRPPVRTLVLVGEHDAVTPPAASRQLAERLGLPGVTTLAQAGHLSNLDQPEAFNRAVLEHLEAAAGKAASTLFDA
ncbi:MAG: alpha/beta hydrolase [Pigmentiphaga sp.]|nr:alpha/beta hydrolase [Pigmentiphaga sp.]